jgi:UbiD family decarboxylase
MLTKEPDVITLCAHPHANALEHIRKNEREGKPTEIATIIGADPTIGITSTTTLPYGVDEYSVAGGLRGRALELVKCETVDIEVPATAEIVIEGKLLSEKETPYIPEGPFGEYTGYQGTSTFSPVYKITCITHRNNPIYQAFISQKPPSESSKLRQISHEAFILRNIKAIGLEGVVDIHMPDTTQAGFIIVSIRKEHAAHPMKVASAVFSFAQPRHGKFVIIVDDDIDVYDLDDVLWAIMFRTSLIPTRRNVRFLEGIRAQALDYSAAQSMTEGEIKDRLANGVIIDATRPYQPYPIVSLPPVKYLKKAREKWDEYGLPKLEKEDLPKCIELEEEYLKLGVVTGPKSTLRHI